MANFRLTADQPGLMVHKKRRSDMRILLHYLFAVAILTIYGGEV